MRIVRALATSTLAQVGLDQNVLINILTAAIQSESGLVKDVAAEALVKDWRRCYTRFGQGAKKQVGEQFGQADSRYADWQHWSDERARRCGTAIGNSDFGGDFERWG